MNVYIYCLLHCTIQKAKKFAKRIIRREKDVALRFVNFTENDFDVDGHLKNAPTGEHQYINDIETNQTISKDIVFPVENLLSIHSNKVDYAPSCRKKGYHKSSSCTDFEEAAQLWAKFIVASKIPSGYRHANLSYAGYIKEYQTWCLPSWIWTNAAIVRQYCTEGQIEEAVEIGQLFLKYQLDSGGWIVRFDYGPRQIKPLAAPNDSAYIANNACLSIYKVTGRKEYLDSAIRCADWIIKTARPDGMVYFGYDTFGNTWETNHNIVDVGFTGGLFAELFNITNEDKYLMFAKKFAAAYTRLFYNKDMQRFWSAISANDNPRGIGFSRGQGWALEGMIPINNIIKDKDWEEIINATVKTLVKHQNKDGSWPRELDKPDLGADCKGTAVIAFSLYDWTRSNSTNTELNAKALLAVKKALDWCVRHTAKDGPGQGGIFSFCYEGAIVHHPYTSTAFVYSNAYALELLSRLKTDCIEL